MKKRNWFTRLFFITLFSLVSLTIASRKPGDLLLQYINSSFLIGLFFLIASGIAIIFTFGVFQNFFKAWKSIYTIRDPYSDSDHWSREDNEEVPLSLTRVEYTITIPLMVGLTLIVESVVLLIFY